MQSLDTSVLIRAIVRDDDEQTARADAVLRGRCFVTITVTLETVWVLTSRYKFTADTIMRKFGIFLRGVDIHFAHSDEIAWALQRFADGADFPDMLHLALSKGATSFVTFDQGIARHAAGSPVPVETL